MESLNLNTLVSSLPTAQQNAEKELLNNFKAAALSITTLYRSSRQNSKRAYNAGYAAACQDMLNFIQQGVSAGGVTGPSDEMEGGGMTIGRVMDWTEARLDAIKAREEEEDEEEEKEKERERIRPTATPTSAPTTNLAAKPDARKATTSGTSASTERPKPSSLPTPHSPTARSIPLPSERSSPSPPSTTTTLRPTQRPTKSKPSTTKGDPPNPSASQVPPFNLISESHPPTSQPFPDTPIAIGAGAKRRHAMMMILDSGSTPVSIGGSSMPPPSPSGPGNINGVYSGSPNHTAGFGMNRRRTRSTRSLTHQAHQQSQNQNINMIQVASEAMDIEEDGRERKRVARR